MNRTFDFIYVMLGSLCIGAVVGILSNFAGVPILTALKCAALTFSGVLIITSSLHQ